MILTQYRITDVETILFVTLYGANRDPRVLEWHKRVMVDKWKLPINYIPCPFHLGMSHGFAMNQLLAATVDSPNPPTYYWWLDNDALLLRREVVDEVYNIVKNKKTVWGQSWSSMHKAKARGGSHPYPSQACLCFSRELYLALGRPDCDHHNPRSDTAEEIGYRAEELGYTVALQYPSKSDEPYTVDLSQTCRYGRSITYGCGDTYHETRADLPGATERFITKCQEVLHA